MSKSKFLISTLKSFVTSNGPFTYISETEFMEVLLSDKVVVEKVYHYNLVTKRVLFVFSEDRSKVVEFYVQSICADCTTFSKCKG